jgi:hypothetical protein
MASRARSDLSAYAGVAMATASALEAKSDVKSVLRSMVFSCHLVGVEIETADAEKCCMTP